jgi:peroxiredoxin
VLAALVLTGGLVATARGAVGVGSALPDVTLRDLSGGAVRLAELRGRPLVITFWATWCTRCIAELDHLKSVRAAHGEDKLRILAVSVDEEREALDEFLRTHSYPFPLYHDPQRAVVSRFVDDEDLPVTAVADSAGTVRYFARDFGEGAAARLDQAIAQVLAPPAP